MSMNYERRVVALERDAWNQIHAMSPREWITCGYVTFDALPSHEKKELLEILEQSFDDHGNIDHRRLTPEQQVRGGALTLKSGEVLA